MLRLFAALQVVVSHISNYQKVTVLPGFLQDGIKYFPGVIIFFIISGFLIFTSYDRSRNISQYSKNRMLRIFPALWVASGILFALMISAGYLINNDPATIKWILGQVTFFQIYLPTELKEYSGYAPNPSLWTIPIEFSFYVVVPAIFWVARKTKIMSMSAIIIILIALSFLFNYYLFTVSGEDEVLFSLLSKNFFSYLFYFLLGSLVYLNFNKMKYLYEGKGFYWLALYVSYAFIAGAYFDLYKPIYHTNEFGLVGAIVLSQTIISLAYTVPGLSYRLLKGTDISYGLYLYHMIIINLFIRMGFTADGSTFLPVITLSVAVAYLSWIIVEKPAIALKYRDLIPIWKFRRRKIP